MHTPFCVKHKTCALSKRPKFYATRNDDIATQMAFKENYVSEEVAGYVNHTAWAGYDNGSKGIRWGTGAIKVIWVTMIH